MILTWVNAESRTVNVVFIVSGVDVYMKVFRCCLVFYLLWRWNFHKPFYVFLIC